MMATQMRSLNVIYPNFKHPEQKKDRCRGGIDLLLKNEIHPKKKCVIYRSYGLNAAFNL